MIRPVVVLFLLVACLIIHTSTYQPDLDTIFATIAKEGKIVNNHTIPPGVNCTHTEWCDKYNICSIVCAPGTVEIPAWQTHAIAAQNHLSYRQNFCYAYLMGTHNSAITLVDGYGNEDIVYNVALGNLSKYDPIATFRTNDQYFSLTDQLRMGLRFLELDTHYVGDLLRIAHCGGVDFGPVNDLIQYLNKKIEEAGLQIRWDTETIGCSPSLSAIPVDEQRPFVNALQEVSAWLDKNPGEFVMIFLDDDLDLITFKQVPVLTQVVQAAFGSRLLTPPEKEKLFPNGWPPINSLIELGKQVLVASGANYSTLMADTLFNKYGPDICNWTEPDTTPYQGFPVCLLSDPTVVANNGTFIRIETSEIMYGPFNAGFHLGPNIDPLTANNSAIYVACNVNVLSPDLLTPDVAASMLWTWAPNQPPSECLTRDNNSTTDCSNLCTALNISSSRWVAEPCDSNLQSACLSVPHTPTSFEWRLSSEGIFEGSACPEGFFFLPPNTPYQQSALVGYASELKGSSSGLVWLNHPVF